MDRMEGDSPAWSSDAVGTKVMRSSCALRSVCNAASRQLLPQRRVAADRLTLQSVPSDRESHRVSRQRADLQHVNRLVYARRSTGARAHLDGHGYRCGHFENDVLAEDLGREHPCRAIIGLKEPRQRLAQMKHPSCCSLSDTVH